MSSPRLDLRGYGQTFATRDRAREIFMGEARTLDPTEATLIVDVTHVDAMSPSFCDELVAQIQQTWPGATIQIVGADYLAETISHCSMRRGLAHEVVQLA